MATSKYLQRIRDEFPELKWTRHRRIHDGVDHVVILLDGEIIFRFEDAPDDEDTNLARERAVLNSLRGKLSIPIPDYAYLPESPDFAGYKAIPGTRLSPWRFQRLSKQSRAEAARRLGAFLSDVHAFPVEEARRLGVEEEPSQFADAKSMVERLFDQFCNELEPETRELCGRWIDDIRGRHHPAAAAFIHSDFWHKHIYHDPMQGCLTGIIDWGDICISDPAWDFFGLWAYGEAFVDSVLSHYARADSELKERSRDCYRVKVVSSSCFPVRRTRKYARQLLTGTTEQIMGDLA